jgi:hypothetical protein
MGIHIHAPKATAKTIHWRVCPDCKRNSPMAGFFTPWYGWDLTCLRCGRSWMDGEWMPLDFTRGARAKNIGKAKKRWRAMPPVSANHLGLD